MAGRWWVRSCSAAPRGSELEVRLQGPGWYWVDERDGAFAVRQQVPFDLSIEVACRVHADSSRGVLSFWFEPTRAPSISVKASEDLDVRSKNAWGALLQLLPFSSVSARASQKFSGLAAKTLQGRLVEGATLTYEVSSGQADAALRRLAAGVTPTHPFKGDSTWIVNDRLFLAPSGAHVVGPIEPGSLELDVNVEQGAGLDYRAVCAEHMADNFGAVSSGRIETIAAAAVVGNGVVAGVGEHMVPFQLDACKFYLVLSALPSSTSVVALRIHR